MASGNLGNGNLDFEKEMEALLSDHPRPHGGGGGAAFGPDSDLSIYRSGSAPPTVELSRKASDGIPFLPPRAAPSLADEELRAHPDYAKYYLNLNPRLPHRREDWRAVQRQSPGGIGDLRQGVESSSLFSVQPGPSRPDWHDNNSNVAARMGPRRNSFAHLLQEDFGRSASTSRHLSRSLSRSGFDSSADHMGLSDVQLTQHLNSMSTVDDMLSGSTFNGLARVQNVGSKIPQSSVSAVPRSITPDTQLFRRTASPCPLPIGGRNSDINNNILSNGFTSASTHMADCSDMAITFSSLDLSDKITEVVPNHALGLRQQDVVGSFELPYSIPGDRSQYIQQSINGKAKIEPIMHQMPLPSHDDFSRGTGIVEGSRLSTLTSNGHGNLLERLPFRDARNMVDAGSISFRRATGYQRDMKNMDFAGCESNAYSANQELPLMLNNQLDQDASLSSASEGQYSNHIGNQVGSGLQVHSEDELFAQYLQRASNSLAVNPSSISPTSLGRNYMGILVDSPALQDEYLEAFLTQQKLHYNNPLSGKTAGINNDFCGNPALSLGMSYPRPLHSSFVSSFDPTNTPRQNERLPRFPSISRTVTGGPKGPWNHEIGVTLEGYASMLEELKTNKTRSFELSEIVGHVVMFSTDQHGSRFIQQKLESASVEEKTMIFPEILPHAYSLMTDVFGNYVIQKFFEHGTKIQRYQLADKLIGHVLILSLQMYGCRVIQKALEVVDVDRQIQMVSELDGHVLKCVYDQNGNHVIQKCIECVPQEKIQFIISSFYGQVVELSMHLYGCRVIQRVLKFCNDKHTQSKMMDEIMQSVNTLALDQYGNYVIQHVLEEGKKEERTAVISKLAGQIVKMSQQKYASNVIEKCLLYGTAEERQLLIDEMLGSTNESEHLETMMKDQYGNYVVQKVLETCEDQIRELILSRIKVHLNSLKRYTYGKHIVARIEKLITAGEMHIGMPNST